VEKKKKPDEDLLGFLGDYGVANGGANEPTKHEKQDFS